MMTHVKVHSTNHDRALSTIEQSVTAFIADPSWRLWQQLRRRHDRYMTTHMLFPGREVDVIRALWSAVCEGPFTILGWSRNSFVQAVNDLVAIGAVIPLIHPDHIGARLAGLQVSGNGECCYVELADDAIGAIMLENDEVVTWLYPVLAFHQAQAHTPLAPVAPIGPMTPTAGQVSSWPRPAHDFT